MLQVSRSDARNTAKKDPQLIEAAIQCNSYKDQLQTCHKAAPTPFSAALKPLDEAPKYGNSHILETSVLRPDVTTFAAAERACGASLDEELCLAGKRASLPFTCGVFTNWSPFCGVLTIRALIAVWGLYWAPDF